MKNTALVFAVALQLVACATEAGSAPADEGPSGFSRSRSVASLTSDEASRLCDWSLETQGGPGKRTECGAGSSRVTHTKDECLEDIAIITKLAGCYPLTVGEVEDCSKETAADHCGEQPTCNALNERVEKCAGKD